MSDKKEKIAIINRSFWPVYPVIGEALLRYAERESFHSNICVIMQDHANIRSQLLKHKRGDGVRFFPCKAWSVSGSGVIRRVLDAIFFMVWVLLVLIWKRPTKVYVSTDPPVLVPFIVMVYCKFSSSKFIYHIQDIHPEAADVVIPVNKFMFNALKGIDSLVIRQADLLITITTEMREEIRTRSHTIKPIAILSNPSVSFEQSSLSQSKKLGFTFCGNAGRLQRIPLLISSISRYCDNGGKLPFVFAGAGVYAQSLRDLAKKYPNVEYLGQISSEEAAKLSSTFTWALLPIEDEVTRFAFPSKSSSYVFSGAFIAAICGEHTSVAEWVSENKLGSIIPADADSLFKFFQQVEKGGIDYSIFNIEREELKSKLSFAVFIKKLTKLINLERSAYEK
ncbi:glycosyltransferase [Reinekea marina]|uniref:Glycosyltransferase n=1 Tax=Reinekea marina TaxID=1310421 RepID=A0ABV7WT00_9GAMM|nr:glycosyltransferase [Reinekea marina]MDN3649320.1 glycosyltransferase [Reinekea marina]